MLKNINKLNNFKMNTCCCRNTNNGDYAFSRCSIY